VIREIIMTQIVTQNRVMSMSIILFIIYCSKKMYEFARSTRNIRIIIDKQWQNGVTVAKNIPEDNRHIFVIHIG
jgi:hypothetical protein